MPTSDLYTEQERRERYAQWVADQSRTRLETFLAKRPKRFAAPGNLNPELLPWADQIVAGQTPNLKIVGNIGSGKSWNLWKLGEYLIEHGFLGLYEIVPAHTLKALIAPPVDLDELRKLAQADLLALDDVAAIRVSDWDADHLYGLFDDRWAADRPTIVASNMPVLGEVLGERASSRMSDNLTTVKVAGRDRRSAK
jgi:DNA replication protein DnaC